MSTRTRTYTILRLAGGQQTAACEHQQKEGQPPCTEYAATVAAPRTDPCTVYDYERVILVIECRSERQDRQHSSRAPFFFLTSSIMGGGAGKSIPLAAVSRLAAWPSRVSASPGLVPIISFAALRSTSTWIG